MVLLADDNWALPYARLGYRPPAQPSHAAARAMALAAGDGGRMTRGAAACGGQPSDDEMKRWQQSWPATKSKRAPTPPT